MSNPADLHDIEKMPPPWMSYPETRQIMAAFKAGGGEGRFVGGCVRDAALGQISDDLDICTNLTPEQVTKALEKDGIRVIPTGLSHGTVTALVNNRKFEVTTLRVDVKTDGRHADVQFTKDWQEDAARRDFTFNALYFTENNVLIDYFDGLNDLAAGRVRFIGIAEDRIEEDRLRVLRYFRFLARFGRGIPNAKALEACRKSSTRLGNLSAERITKEMLILLEHRGSVDALDLMQETGVLEALIPGEVSLQRLERLLALPKISDTAQRLCVLFQGNEAWAQNISKYLRLPTKVEKRLVQMCREASSFPFEIPAQKKKLYKLGAEAFIDRLLLAWSNDPENTAFSKCLVLAKNWKIPVFPVKGGDLLEIGLPAGPEIGAALKKLEDSWMENDFKGTKQGVLKAL